MFRPVTVSGKKRNGFVSVPRGRNDRATDSGGRQRKTNRCARCASGLRSLNGRGSCHRRAAQPFLLLIAGKACGILRIRTVFIIFPSVKAPFPPANTPATLAASREGRTSSFGFPVYCIRPRFAATERRPGVPDYLVSRFTAYVPALRRDTDPITLEQRGQGSALTRRADCRKPELSGRFGERNRPASRHIPRFAATERRPEMPLNSGGREAPSHAGQTAANRSYPGVSANATAPLHGIYPALRQRNADPGCL